MIRCLWFGRIGYLDGLRIQEAIYNKVRNGNSSTHYLCLFEHNPVYTVGLREHLFSVEEEYRLKNLGAEFHRVKRGGLITFHGPGQLVAYPIINLRQLKPIPTTASMGVRCFVNNVEEVLIRLLTQHYKIQNVRRTGDTGVWVEENRKIAAIGIQVRFGISTHGLALNCNTDLKWFDHIVPCGLEGKLVTSISRELNQIVDIKDVLSPLIKNFENVFQVSTSFHSISDSTNSFLNSDFI